jgi:hypothetical protein
MSIEVGEKEVGQRGRRKLRTFEEAVFEVKSGGVDLSKPLGRTLGAGSVSFGIRI